MSIVSYNIIDCFRCDGKGKNEEITCDFCEGIGSLREIATVEYDYQPNKPLNMVTNNCFIDKILRKTE